LKYWPEALKAPLSGSTEPTLISVAFVVAPEPEELAGAFTAGAAGEQAASASARAGRRRLRRIKARSSVTAEALP
jgi:hypothetical protein